MSQTPRGINPFKSPRSFSENSPSQIPPYLELPPPSSSGVIPPSATTKQMTGTNLFNKYSTTIGKIGIILKFVVLGESEVGKTTILRKFYMNKGFPASSTTPSTTPSTTQPPATEPTVGIDFIHKRITLSDYNCSTESGVADKLDIKLHFWDTSGKPCHRVVISSFMKDYCGAILVYDVLNAESFAMLPHWLDYVRRSSKCVSANCRAHPILLLANVRNHPHKRRVVSYEQGASFALNNGLMFFECDSDVSEAFQYYIRTVIEVHLNQVLCGNREINRDYVSSLRLCNGIRVEYNVMPTPETDPADTKHTETEAEHRTCFQTPQNVKHGCDYVLFENKTPSVVEYEYYVANNRENWCSCKNGCSIL